MAAEFRPLPGVSQTEQRKDAPELKPAPKTTKRSTIGGGGQTDLDRALGEVDLRRVSDGREIGRRLRELGG